MGDYALHRQMRGFVASADTSRRGSGHSANAVTLLCTFRYWTTVQ